MREREQRDRSSVQETPSPGKPPCLSAIIAGGQHDSDTDADPDTLQGLRGMVGLNPVKVWGQPLRPVIDG